MNNEQKILSQILYSQESFPPGRGMVRLGQYFCGCHFRPKGNRTHKDFTNHWTDYTLVHDDGSEYYLTVLTLSIMERV